MNITAPHGLQNILGYLHQCQMLLHYYIVDITVKRELVRKCNEYVYFKTLTFSHFQFILEHFKIC